MSGGEAPAGTAAHALPRPTRGWGQVWGQAVENLADAPVHKAFLSHPRATDGTRRGGTQACSSSIQAMNLSTKPVRNLRVRSSSTAPSSAISPSLNCKKISGWPSTGMSR